MSTRNRIIAVTMSLALTLGVAACGSSADHEEADTTGTIQPEPWDLDPRTHVHVSTPVTLEGVPACPTWDGHKGDKGGWEHVCYWDQHDGSPAYLLVYGAKVASWKR